jgi:hypothetical protein
MHDTFPKIKSVRNNGFHKNVTEYLQINRDMKIYNEIIKEMDAKQNAINWISKDVLYKKYFAQNNRKSHSATVKPLWRLEAVFPKHNMAIINSQFIHKGSTLNEAKIMQIKFDSVLLKTNKGLKWLHLFH